MKYAVLGGAGSMGRIIVRDLVEFSERGDEIVVADYNLEAARALVRSLPKRKAQVTAARVDVGEIRAASKTLAGSFVLINSVQYQRNLEVMALALALGAHYIDLGGLFHMTRKQLAWNARYQKAGKLALIGMGAAPGVTNLLARSACERLDQVHEIHARVAGLDLTRYEPRPALAVSYSLQTILEEFSAKPAVFTRGKFAFVEPMSGDLPHRFPSPVGIARPMFTLHSEVATLPLTYAEKGIREVSFKIAFDPEFLDRVRFLRDVGLASEVPVLLGGMKVKPVELVNRVVMGNPKPRVVGPLRQREILRAIVKGVEKKRKVTWVVDCHTFGMPKWEVGTDINTGSPPAIAARMLARGEIPTVGVAPPERAVPPKIFFAELQKRGMHIKATRLWGHSLKT